MALVQVEIPERSRLLFTSRHGDGQTIPPEVWDLVIDAAADDPRTMKTCAVICRAFLSRSRHHLFQSVTITTSGAAESLIPAFKRTPEIRGVVRELRLGSLRSTIDREIDWVMRALQTLLPMFCSLQRLSLCYLQLSSPALLELLSPARHTLSTLDLTWCTFDDFAAFARLLVALPSIKDLKLHSVALGPMLPITVDDADFQHPGMSGIMLSTLHLHERYLYSKMGILFQWLSKTSTFASLRRLHLHPAISQSAHDTEYLARLAKESPLETLVLDCANSSSTSLHSGA